MSLFRRRMMLKGTGAVNPVVKYPNSISSFSPARSDFAATQNGAYGILVGGLSITGITSTFYANADAYNASLTRSVPASISKATEYLAAAQAGTSALFAGGCYEGTYPGAYLYDSAYAYAYNQSLSLSTATSLSSARSHIAAGSTPTHAIFAGGVKIASDPNVVVNTVDAYNSSLTRTTPTALSVARCFAGTGSINGNLLVVGGNTSYDADNYSPTGAVDVYNASLTRSTLASVPATSEPRSGNAGNYCVFDGGYAYNSSLTRMPINSRMTTCHGSGTVNSCAVFVDMTLAMVLDSSLVQYNIDWTNDFASSVYNNSSKLGNYTLFFDGYSTFSPNGHVIAYMKNT